MCMLDLSEILLNKCIEKYDNVVNQDNARYGAAPKSIIIVYSNGDLTKPNSLSDINRAWQYKEGTLKDIPTEAKAKRKPISGMYFNEAFAEFSYDLSSKMAFINIYFGPRFARGYEYTIVEANNEYDIGDEVILWIS